MRKLLMYVVLSFIIVALLAVSALAKSPLLKKHEAEMAAYDQRMVVLKVKTEAARKAREDQEAVNNAINKVLFLPVRPFAMGGMYLSKFVTGVSKGDLKASAQATFLVVVSPLNLAVVTVGDFVTLTDKKSPYGPPGKEAIAPPF